MCSCPLHMMMMLLSAHPPPPHLIKITCSGEGAERRKCYAGDEDTLLCCITLVLYSILLGDVLHSIPLFYDALQVKSSIAFDQNTGVILSL